MKNWMRLLSIPALACLAGPSPAFAETVSITGGAIYVSKNDCLAIARYRPSPGVAYQPGVDVHGKQVAPADLGGDKTINSIFPDGKVRFVVEVNPMDYAQGQAGVPPVSSLSKDDPYRNTALPVAKVEIDLNSGETFINGEPLTAEQDRLLRETCQKAGYR